jgi:hypothetical protein
MRWRGSEQVLWGGGSRGWQGRQLLAHVELRRLHTPDQGGCQEQKGPGTILGRTVNGWAVMGGIDKTPECCVVSS